MIPFTFLRASLNQSARSSISYSDRMHSRILDIASDNINDLVGVRDIPVSQ